MGLNRDVSLKIHLHLRPRLNMCVELQSLTRFCDVHGNKFNFPLLEKEVPIL